MNINNSNQKPQKFKYYNPLEGFTKGTKQGIYVSGALLTILLILTFFTSVIPGTPRSRVLDLVFGLCAAVTVVWVIGGIFEIEGKIWDFGVKATGGAAILFLIIFQLQPISKSNPSPKYEASFVLTEYETLDSIISEIEDWSRAEEVSYAFNFNGNEKEIRQFRPISPGKKTTYNANDWPSIFEKIDRDSPCLDVTMTPDDVISLQFNVSNTITKEIKIDSGLKVIRLCN